MKHKYNVCYSRKNYYIPLKSGHGIVRPLWWRGVCKICHSVVLFVIVLFYFDIFFFFFFFFLRGCLFSLLFNFHKYISVAWWLIELYFRFWPNHVLPEVLSLIAPTQFGVSTIFLHSICILNLSCLPINWAQVWLANIGHIQLVVN